MIKMGMIGGGPGSFIGEIHRLAVQFSHNIQLVCGVFSRDYQKSLALASELGIAAQRTYATYEEMFAQESRLPCAQRMDFVVIVTPNHEHFKPAALALHHGFHVMCDKPLCLSLDEAEQLQAIVRNSALFFGMTYNYTGYAMVKLARHLIANQKLGKLSKIWVEYPQAWLTEPIEQAAHKQAAWRTNPQHAGLSGCIADIGTHAENLATYVTGLELVGLCADLSASYPHRQLDDDGSALLRYENNVRGVLMASQVAVGEENNLRLRVYGSLGALEWQHRDSQTLQVKLLNQPVLIYRAGSDYLPAIVRDCSFLPAGHSGGFIESFANIYRNFTNAIAKKNSNIEPNEQDLDFPSIEDGVRGMRFIEACVKSSQWQGKWQSCTS